MKIEDKVKEIKQSFKLYMDGEVARSMRDKGLCYFVNWGIQLSRLKEMATQYGKDADLALLLWRDNTRECKILAALIMPPEARTRQLADYWVSGMTTQEIAEICSLHLFQYIRNALPMAQEWLSSNDDNTRICACNVISRVVMKGQYPQIEDVKKIAENLVAAANNGGVGLRRAATNCLTRIVDCGDEYSTVVNDVIKKNSTEPF